MLELLEQGRWHELVRELMVLYYDPLYNHTKPARRIEIDVEPETPGLERLKAVIAEVLAQPVITSYSIHYTKLYEASTPAIWLASSV